MNDRSLKRMFAFYAVSVTFCIIQVILAWLFASFLISAYKNGVLPSSPLIQSVFQDVIAALLVAMFLFVGSIFAIAIWSAVSEVRARNRFFRLNYELRKRELERQAIELEQQRRLPRQRETAPPITRRVSANLRPGTTPLRASRPRRVDTYRTYRRE
jgi:signal transduction histidine kinase